jgi:hypothetical protein
MARLGGTWGPELAARGGGVPLDELRQSNGFANAIICVAVMPMCLRSGSRTVPGRTRADEPNETLADWHVFIATSRGSRQCAAVKCLIGQAYG